MATRRRLARTGEPSYRSSSAAPAWVQDAPFLMPSGFAPAALNGPLARPLRVTYPPYGPKRVARSGAVFTPWDVLQIRVPRKAQLCVARSRRREVLFALKRAGFRGSAPKRRYRRTQNSLWRC